MTEQEKNWTQDNSLFLTLTPAKLAQALEASMNMEGLSDTQKLYARVVLLSIASNSVPIMEERARMEGSLPARMLSPAHSIPRMALYEPGLYDLIEKGDIEGMRGIIQHQQITSTAHPNFSRSRELVAKSREIISELGDMRGSDIQAVAETGKLPDSVIQMLTDIRSMLKPRAKRSRADELHETALDLIPIAMAGASRQIDLVKERKAAISGGDELKFKSLNQLRAVAEMLPEYNSWFVDGDGKRSCHVYDTEVALPAIKRTTYENYLKSMDNLPTTIGNFSTTLWKRTLSNRINALKEIEELATERMNAFNDLHATYSALQSDTGNHEARHDYSQALATAQSVSLRYMKMLKTIVNDGSRSIPMIDLLKEDTAGQIRGQLGPNLESAYRDELKLKPIVRAMAEDLYIKLERYGNFAIRPQRRENAAQYRTIFEYLVQPDDSALKDVIERDVAKAFGYRRDEINSQLDHDQKFYSAAVEAVTKSAMDPKDPATREYIFNSYKKLASKLEKTLANHQGDTIVMKPLEPRELLALDGLGHFNMARLYPEAFKAGFVIAEFAQPELELLKTGDAASIRDDVARLARTDMNLQLAFANAMGASGATIIPLHEDPSTIAYIPEAQGALRSGPVMEYLVKWAGADTPENAELKALRYLNKNNEPEFLNAYQYLQRFGASAEELEKKGLDAEALKHTRVLEGPPDMEACSDIGKRATVMGSELVEQSIREKAIAAAKYPVRVAGTDYIIVKPKYLGQGGSIARATGVPTDTVQYTLQGEHLNNQVPASLADAAHHRMLSRYNGRQEAIRNDERADALQREKLEAVAGGAAYHVSNLLGLKGYGIKQNERELLQEAMTDRLTSTRDDPRYNDFLAKYGEPAPNYSARPDSKGGKVETFDSGRAIGIAAKEQGVYPNIIGISSIFDFGSKGTGRDEVTQRNVEELRRWVSNDPYMQQMMVGASITANMVDMEDKWKRGGIHYEDKSGVITLGKDGERVPLGELLKAYKAGAKEFHSGGAHFDAGDLVMAYHTEQFRKLSKGLKAFYGVKKLEELTHPAHRETIAAYRQLQRESLRAMHDPAIKGPDSELARGAYYVLAEGGSLAPLSGNLEQDIARTGSARGAARG